MSAGGTDRSNQVFAGFLAAAISFVVYFLTLSQSVGWHDSAELALVASQLGASHAPGSPLHSILGHFMAQFYDDAFRGTVLLSALSAAASTGILAFLICALKRDFVTALTAALIYAFSYQVWASAVVTEIYSLGMLFFSITLLYALLWLASGKRRYFSTWTVFYALTLGTYFANILLFPAFAYLIYCASQRKAADLLTFAAVTGLAVVLIGIANYFLAMNALPFGEVAPDSITNMLLYMSGSQHAPLQIRDSIFLLTRLTEHLGIFSRSLLFIGFPLGLLGAVSLVRADKVPGVFLLLIFSIYMVYYTVFGPGDYFMMVLPAYFVFSIWISVGVQLLLRFAQQRPWQWALRLLPVLLIAGLIVVQFNGRRIMARSLEAESFAETTFDLLPADAVAITGWKEFPTLRYYQELRGMRPDIRFIVPARSIRRYSFGEVDDYVDFVGSAICSAPVYTTKELPGLGEQYELQEEADSGPWKRVTGVSDARPDFCR